MSHLDEFLVASDIELSSSNYTTSTPSQYLDDSVSSVKFALALNSIILLAALCAFEVLISNQKTRGIVAPRLQSQSQEEPIRGCSCPFWWIRQAIHHGKDIDVDGSALVRFCNLGFKFSIAGSLIGCVLIPVYVTTGHGVVDDVHGFNKYGLSNLQSDDPSPNFWVAVVAAYLLTAVFAHLVNAEWHNFVDLRFQHFAKACQGELGPGAAQAQRSLIVEAVPPSERSAEQLHNFFEETFGKDSVHSCLIQPDTQTAYQSAAMRTATSRCCCCCCCRSPPLAIERIADRVAVGVNDARSLTERAQEALESARPQHTSDDMSSSSFGSWSSFRAPTVRGVTNEAVRGLGDVGHNVLDRSLQAARLVTDATVGGGKVSTAFVTLNRVADRIIAEQLVLSRSGGWIIKPAPEANTILWKNVTVPISQVRTRQVVGLGVCLVGLVFWSVPVSLVQAWASMSSLEKYLPFVKSMCGQASEGEPPILCTTLTSYMPVLALMALLQLLPRMLEWLASTYEKRKVWSEIQGVVLCRNLYYQLATLYVTVLSSSLFESVQIFLESGPMAALDEFGRQVPQVSVYFITFVLARSGMSLSLLLLQLPTSLGHLRGNTDSVVHCYFESEAADVALVLILGLTYSVLAPFIMLACALYFGLASLVYRYLFLHVYTPRIDRAGALWYDLFQASALGLIIGNCVMTSLAALYQGWYSLEFAFMVPLPLLSAGFLSYCNNFLRPASLCMTFRDAVETDQRCEKDAAASSVMQHFRSDYYLDPMARSETTNTGEDISQTVSMQFMP